MQSLGGVRVVRGPDWKWGDQDGGEGNAGTVIDTPDSDYNIKHHGPRTVTVVWDSGIKAQYRAGPLGYYDLRIVNNASMGVKHPGISCGAGKCSVKEIAGIRWQCVECQLNLCSSCFYQKVPHNASHRQFKRYDSHCITDPPTVFSCYKNDDRIKLIGNYPRAKVIQGPAELDDPRDYYEMGLVLPNPNSDDEVLVEWSSKNVKKTHIRGHRDIKTKVPAVGGYYHPNALAVLVSNSPTIPTSSAFAGLQLSALHIACKEGQKDVVQMLLHEGKADVNSPDENGFRAVHYAVKYNEVEILKILIAKGVQLDIQNNSGKTALHLAVSNQFAECCRLLIDAGCDVNKQDAEGDTPLHCAIHGGRLPKIIQILLSCHEKINWKLRNRSGFNVLQLALLKIDYWTFFDMLPISDNDLVLERICDSQLTVLHYACFRRDINVAKAIVDHVKSMSNVPTLLLQMLLEARTKSGKTALLIACDRKDYALMDLLFKAGADPNVQDYEENSAFDVAQKSIALVYPLVPKEMCPSVYEDKDLVRYQNDGFEDISLTCYLLDRGCDWEGGNNSYVEDLEERNYPRKLINALHRFAAKCLKRNASIRPRIIRPHDLPDDGPPAEYDGSKAHALFRFSEMKHVENLVITKDLDGDIIWKSSTSDSLEDVPLSDYVFELTDEGTNNGRDGYVKDQSGNKYNYENGFNGLEANYRCIREATVTRKRRCKAVAKLTKDRIDGTVTIRLESAHHHRVE